MIDLYFAPTANGFRVQLMLEELGLPYVIHQISLTKREHQSREFLKLNPSGRIPVIIDKTDGNNEPLLLTQSLAILIYLAEKTGKLLPSFDLSAARARTFEWLSFDATDMATTRFDAFYLSLHKQVEAEKILKERTIEYYNVYDQRLANSRYLAGDKYSVADVAAYPWARSMQEPPINKFEHLQRWIKQIEDRAAVRAVWEN